MTNTAKIQPDFSYKQHQKSSIHKKKEIKVCQDRLRWLQGINFKKSKKVLNSFTHTQNSGEFQYTTSFWTANNSKYTSVGSQFEIENSPKRNTYIGDKLETKYRDFFFKNFFKNLVNTRKLPLYHRIIGISIKKKVLHIRKKEFLDILDKKGNGISVSLRVLKRKSLKLAGSAAYGFKASRGSKLRTLVFEKIIDSKKSKNNIKTPNSEFSTKRFWKYFNRDAQSLYTKNLLSIGFPGIEMIKRTSQFLNFPRSSSSYRDNELSQIFIRHPASTHINARNYLITITSFDRFNGFRYKEKPKMSYALFYGITWRYFKMKIEGFFYKQLGVRMHVWFLNVWDIFINGLDSQWHWFRYENSTIRFLTRKGQKFLIESRESAKFYVRTMALTLTMVGGAKLFMDNVSLMLAKYRNNWAFILHVTRSLRFCINFFWFRFFINYKVTLQGKIGGFLRAAKKTFKKGIITIEDRASAITYYRGFPVTRFGSYNLSFWIQYRIPTLIGKFEDLEYIDTMKILLGTYSVPWLAKRLAGIVSAILQDRVYKINIKVAQYDRRLRTREKLYVDLFNKNKEFLKESLYFNEGSLVAKIRKNNAKKIINEVNPSLSLKKNNSGKKNIIKRIKRNTVRVENLKKKKATTEKSILKKLKFANRRYKKKKNYKKI